MSASTLNSETDLTQKFHCNYSANHLLPTIHWNSLLSQNQLHPSHVLALQTIYEVTVPLALTTLQRLNIDIFAPHEKKPQGLDLFNKLRALEPRLIEQLAQATASLDHQVRHQIWSMMLRGAAILVFKAWLGKVKTGEDRIDLTYFNELGDLLWLEVDPYALAARLNVDLSQSGEHLVLFYQDRVLLDRFNNLATAELFVNLGLYDAVFLALSDEKVCAHFIDQGLVSQNQVDDLMDSLNPLFTDLPQTRHRVVQFYH
ncbi:hypothetical protein ACF3NA_09910 [Alkanindiges sp. WGS2144]|uniref:hypothetical protein n=1 Tax=Alkanindiges sp. WGS2144 TaxID=3366808 RepID=UPI003751AA26